MRIIIRMRSLCLLRTCIRMAKKVLDEELAHIGKRLKELRVANGYTSYRQLADSIDIEPKGVWEIEEGKKDFRYSTLKRILDAYGVTLAEFYASL